jgi:hypothetical protein
VYITINVTQFGDWVAAGNSTNIGVSLAHSFSYFEQWAITLVEMGAFGTRGLSTHGHTQALFFSAYVIVCVCHGAKHSAAAIFSLLETGACLGPAKGAGAASLFLEWMRALQGSFPSSQKPHPAERACAFSVMTWGRHGKRGIFRVSVEARALVWGPHTWCQPRERPCMCVCVLGRA